MMLRRAVMLWIVAVVCLVTAPAKIGALRQDLPTRLADGEFWQIVTDFSEPDGFFNSDNLVSNEDTFQAVIPELIATVKPGGVYLGVGPDQNFTYILALQPRIAFIADVRRGNLLVQLMYKALIELSSDRADFAARLFSRPRPSTLPSSVSPGELLTAVAASPADDAAYRRNLRALLEHLVVTHGFTLSAEDRAGIEFAYQNFVAAGPRLTFVSNGGGGGRNRYPSYMELQVATDLAGVNHSYLASEARFQALKDLQKRNLIVPIVGNFAGPSALRRVGAYVREHGATVTAFYTSNVEQYLFQDRLWDTFRANVAALPTGATSTFIRSCFNSCSSPGGSRAVTLLDSIPALLRDAAAGRVQSYWDVLNHSRQAVAQ